MIVFIFREGEGREKRWRGNTDVERNIDWLLLVRTSTRDRTGNPGLCPDLGSHQ